MTVNNDRYELISQTYIEELRAEGILLKHKKSGARIALMCNDDENKVFSIGFRTPPPDSTGVPHILEHSVLCGSDKYPVKDPFIELAKGSLNTFLNAMTYPDKTVYPIASCNDADFKNLMDVYMDAVLHPLIASRKEVFMQEGWHYEMKDATSPITYNGVVYNEMKGAFSSPDDVLSRYCLNSLYPDTSYSTESGGDPADIPKLTYENFIAFHKKLYHPSNSYIYIYGNCDMEERLDYLDKEYLSHYDCMEVDSEIKSQKPFDSMIRVEAEYSVTEEEGTEERNYLSYNVSVGDALDLKTCMAFDILDYALFSAPGAPVKQAILDAGIGDDVFSTYEDGIKQPMLCISAKNVAEGREEEFLDVIKTTLKKLVKEGINRQTLEAGINSEEFRYREADFGRFPKGLMYGLEMMDTWIFNEGNPFEVLVKNHIFGFLRDNIDTGYFEELVEKYLINNTHASLVVLKPVVNLVSLNEKKTAEELEAYKATLSYEDIERIVEETKALKKYQSEPSTEEELMSIPLLQRSDISREVVPLYNEEKEVAGVKVVHHDIYTNGIGYVNVCFDIAGVADEDIPYLGLLGTVLGYVDTENYTYDELSNEVDINTGGVFPDFNVYADFKDDEAYQAYFQVKGKALVNKFDVLFALAKEMMFNAKYDDYKRMREILAEIKSRLQSKILSSGHTVAMGECMSQMKERLKFTDLTSGIAYYKFICDIYENFEDRKEIMAEKLENICKTIFTKQGMLISLTVDGSEYEGIAGELAGFIETVPDVPIERVKRNFALNKVKKGYKTASQVNYVARCGAFSKQGYEYDASLKVLKSILGYDYLWNNVRVMGGAYGCMNGFAHGGTGFLLSYRDPNCRATNEVYEGVVDYIRNFSASEREMTKYVIGTISDMDVPLTPSTKGIRSFSAYISGETEADFKADREKVLDTTEEDIRGLADLVKAVLEDDYLCVIGSNDKITEDKDMFDEISTLS